MKYYLHDSNAFSDEKITKLYIKYGYEGLGLFYTALEKFAAQEKPIDTKVLHKQLHIGKRLSKVWEFMEEIGIICSSNGESFNKELLNFSHSYQIKKQNTAKRVADFRARHENVTRYDRVSNAPKVKLSKVNVLNTCAFEQFWSIYPKKKAKQDALKAFNKISPNDSLLTEILKGVENYSKTDDWQKEDGKYIPLPATFLRGGRWEDEINPKIEKGSNEFRDQKW